MTTIISFNYSLFAILFMKYKLFFPLLLMTLSYSCFANDSTLIKCSAILKNSILIKANEALKELPITITASYCKRSAGGIHDFYSEGDYWWPNPISPDSPYIQKDGLSNPNNFTNHRNALIRFSKIIGYFSSAYLLTDNEIYVRQAVKHLNEWFVDTSTLMNPSLLYAQAINGRVTGRGTGIIDMIQMMEVVKGVEAMEKSKAMDKKVLEKTKEWFIKYLSWVTTHNYGIEEREAKNNHGTCWVMQVAVFANFTGNKQLLAYCIKRFKTVLFPNQLDKDGSFPLEMKRTKPYGYSLFNLDAMSTICQELSTKEDNLWEFTLTDGRNMKKAVDFMSPFVANKSLWKPKPDVMYWDYWPVAQPFLLFGYQAFQDKALLESWEKLNHFPMTEEVVRNLPVRNPFIWLKR